MKALTDQIHVLHLGKVNAYLVDHGDLTLIDTGYQGSDSKILEYVRKLGKEPESIKNILLTHLHPDHAGGAAALAERTQAAVWMHPTDAALLEQGISFRKEAEIAPGLHNRLIYNMIIKSSPKNVPALEVHHQMEEGQELPLGAGFKVYHVPGHSKGQVVLLYGGAGGVLFGADIASNFFQIAYMPFYENLAQGKQDIAKISQLEFDKLLLGHGSPVMSRASTKFRRAFRRVLA